MTGGHIIQAVVEGCIIGVAMYRAWRLGFRDGGKVGVERAVAGCRAEIELHARIMNGIDYCDFARKVAGPDALPASTFTIEHEGRTYSVRIEPQATTSEAIP